MLERRYVQSLQTGWESPGSHSESPPTGSPASRPPRTGSAGPLHWAGPAPSQSKLSGDLREKSIQTQPLTDSHRLLKALTDTHRFSYNLTDPLRLSPTLTDTNRLSPVGNHDQRPLWPFSDPPTQTPVLGSPWTVSHSFRSLFSCSVSITTSEASFPRLWQNSIARNQLSLK